jgi:enoyl-CoA hydratase/carnithine racemase
MAETKVETPDARIDYRVENKIAYITLNRAAKLNAFTLAQTQLLHDTLRRFDRDDEAWVAIVNGAGSAFSSGADVKDRQLQEKPELKLNKGENPIHDNMNHGFLEHTVNWKPVIAAVHGYAIGAGLMFLLECDAAIVADDAKLQVTETARGLWSSLHWAYIASSSGTTFAQDVCMTGRFFSGAEAAAAGMVQKAVDSSQVMSAAEDFAKSLLKNPPLAVRHIVRTRRWYAAKDAADIPILKEGFALSDSEDFVESARAFVERRPAAAFKAR